VSKRREYRIVRDGWSGYAVQCRAMGILGWSRWKEPASNTHPTIEAAEKWAINHRALVVKYLGELNEQTAPTSEEK
jgi:hypothetical protein